MHCYSASCLINWDALENRTLSFLFFTQPAPKTVKVPLESTTLAAGREENVQKTDSKGHLALCLPIKNANSICINCEVFGYPERLKGFSMWDGCQGIIRSHRHFIWWVPCLTLKHKAGSPGPEDLLMFLLHGGICTGASEGSGWSMRQCTFLVCIYIEVAGLPRSWEKAERR